MFGRRSDSAATGTVAPSPQTARTTARVRSASASAAPTGSLGKQAYESRRAAQAGMSVEKWREMRARAARDAQQAAQAARPQPKRPPGLLRRLLDRAHRPL